DPWTMCQVTVTYQVPVAFSQIFGLNPLNATAVAQAAHRPRDTAVIMDMSGSMRLDSLLGEPVYGNRTASMNGESDYPQFGHYPATATAALQGASTWQAPTGEIAGLSNIVTPTGDGPAVVNDFYADATAFGTSTPAFVNSVTPAPSSYDTTPGGTAP